MEKKISDKYFKYTYMLLFFVLACLLLLLINRGIQQFEPQGELKEIKINGTWHTQDMEEQELTDYSRLHAVSGETVYIQGYLNEQIAAGDYLMFYLNKVNIKIYINGVPVYYNENVQTPEWGQYRCRGITKKDKITLELSPASSFVYEKNYEELLLSLCAGDRFSLLQRQMAKSLVKITGSILILITGILLLASRFIFSHSMLSKAQGLLPCSLLLISGAVCTFIDYTYITLLFSNAYIVGLVDMLSQALIITFLLFYLRNYIRSEKGILIADIGLLVFMLLVVLYYILTCTNQLQEINQEGVLIVFALVIIGTLLIIIGSGRNGYDLRIRYILISVLVLIACTAVEMIHYYMTNNYWISLYQVGLAEFTVVQIIVQKSYVRDKAIQIEHAKKLEEELSQSQIAIMLSQIQPHFLYNTIAGIQELCLQDAGKAQEALLYFAQFLRGNMKSLTAEGTIPFPQELTHVKNYVYLQKLRFGEDLKVEYEIDEEDFSIPALTVQPLVENAIHYGMKQGEDGVTVQLHTWQDTEAYYVCVADNGPGIELDEDGNVLQYAMGEHHVGMANVRDRIGAQCSGSLYVENSRDGGCRVTIRIPKHR